jgi:hypothetical protein
MCDGTTDLVTTMKCNSSQMASHAAGATVVLQAPDSRPMPAGALCKAYDYTLPLWHRLTRFLEHPQLELSNNLLENSMGAIAVVYQDRARSHHPPSLPPCPI